MLLVYWNLLTLVVVKGLVCWLLGGGGAVVAHMCMPHPSVYYTSF